MTLGVVVFAVLAVVFGTRNLLRGDLLSGVVVYGFVVPFAVILVAVRRVVAGRTVLRANADGTGTTLRADRSFSVLVLAASVVVVVVGAVVVIATLTGQLLLFASERGRIASVVLMGAAAVTAASGLVSAWRRGGVGWVKLTPHGVEVADILRTTPVPWSDIAGVDDHADSKRTRKAVVLKRSDGSEATIDGADFYVPNGAGLYWMVRHYRERVDDRGELTDGRALTRLSEGRFEVGS